MYQDASRKRISPHKNAEEYLFEHYQTLKTIFKQILGYLEIDYLGITLISATNELIFFSSLPSIECNLIKHQLWRYDKSYSEDFFKKNRIQFWEDLYSEEQQELLHYKRVIHDFEIGFSFPALFNDYRVVYTFASRSKDKQFKQNILDNMVALSQMSQVCLQNIFDSIPIPESKQKPVLSLVINNTGKV